MPFSCHYDFAVSWCSNISVAYAYCFDGLKKSKEHRLNIPYPLCVAVRKVGERAGIAYCDRAGGIHHIGIDLSSSSETKTKEKDLACISDDVTGIGYLVDGIAVLGSYGLYYIYPHGNSAGVKKIASWDKPRDCCLLSSENYIAIAEKSDNETRVVSVYELHGKRGEKELAKIGEVLVTGEIRLCGKYLAEIDGMHIRVFAEKERIERKWVAAETICERIWWTDGERVIISAVAGAYHFFLVLPLEEGKGGWGRAVGPCLESISTDAGCKYIYCLTCDFAWGWDVESRGGKLVIPAKQMVSQLDWVKNENEAVYRAEKQGDLNFTYSALARVVLANSDCEVASAAGLYLEN